MQKPGTKILPGHTEMKRAVLALAPLAVIALAGPLRAQRVEGIVLDEVSRQPVQAADVALLGAEGKVAGRTRTGADGRFAIKIPKLGAYAVKVEALGYVIYTSKVFVVDSTQEVSADVDLAPAPLAVPGLTVTTMALSPKLVSDGFYSRQAMGTGDFLTPKQVKSKNAFNFSELFMGMPGLRARPAGNGVGYSLYDIDTYPPCRMGVVIDGEPLQEDMGEELGQTISVQDVLAVEIYPFHGVGAPMLYGLESADRGNCGVVVIWTKNG